MAHDNFRRVVTGHNASGKSIIAEDGPPGVSLGQGGVGLFEMWVNTQRPANNLVEEGLTAEKLQLEPPPTGDRFRFFGVAPENPDISTEQLEQMTEAGFAAIGAAHCRPDTSRHPAMHRTKTIDYIIVLSGKVTLLLDDDETELGPFDVVIQRGTNHAWINKGSEPALLVAVLIDADPLPDKKGA